jgi:preprotein translocase subunit SecG
VFNRLKENSGSKEAGSVLNGRRGRAIPVAVLLIFVVLLSMGSGIYASASFFPQQNVTVTTTIYTTTSWVTSTIWSTVTTTVLGVLTTVQYTTSTSTVTVTGSTTSTPVVVTIPAGGTSPLEYSGNYAIASPITLPSGTVTSIGINLYEAQSGYVRVALYSAGSGKPASLLTQSASTALGKAGWLDIAVTPQSVTAGSYWVAFTFDRAIYVYYTPGPRSYYYKAFSAFDATWSASSGQDSYYEVNMRVTLS